MRTFTEGSSFQRALSKDVYIFNLVRLGGTTTVGLYYFAYIASDDTLPIISVTSPLSSPSINPISVVSKAHQGISCLVALKKSAGLATAGRDGKVKIWVPQTDDRKDWQAAMEVSTR